MASTSQLLTVLAVLLFTVTVEAQNKYAEAIKACYLKDKAKFDTCFKDLWEEFKPDIAAGSPEHGILPMDPLNLEDFQIKEHGAIVQGISSFSNVTMKGFVNYTVTYSSLHKANKSIVTRVTIPALSVTGLYNINGTILLLSVSGEGSFALNLTNVTALFVSQLSRIGGVLTIQKIHATFEIQDIKIDLKGLMGDDAVVDAIKKMFNDNSQEILNDIRPQIENMIETIGLKGFKDLLSGLSEDDIGI